MKVQYIEGTNLAYYNGHKFRKDGKTGYWLCTQFKPYKRLHVYIWECIKGEIPKGYHVHHIDRNKDNNDISNFTLLSDAEHHALHTEELTTARRQQMRENMLTNAIPAAVAWHKTQEGKEWHKKHYGDMGDRLHVERGFICEQCGKPFKSTQVQSRFCSNACKSAYRRASGCDNITRICAVCGKEFITTKRKNVLTCSRSCANVLNWKSRKSKG